LVFAGCATLEVPPDDPLVDRIFRSGDEAELTREGLLEQMDAAQVIYLGEKHDNLRHHELQLAIVKDLLERGRRPAIGFETFSLDRTSLLMSFVSSKNASPGDAGGTAYETRLKEALDWRGGDESWEFYAPLLRFAREHGLVVFGADLSRAMRRRITSLGTAGLTAVEQRQLYPSGFQHPAYEALMRDALKQIHCGYGEPDYIGRLYDNWVARNDAMAAAIVETLDQQDGEPVVMILGAGHVQYNMAAYERVAHHRPNVRQLNLGFREVAKVPEPVQSYTQPIEFDGATFDPDHEYLWFSRRAEQDVDDLCEKFRQHMKKKRSKTPA
jgi:uncharacterized iron-regulated protein